MNNANCRVFNATITKAVFCNICKKKKKIKNELILKLALV